MASPRFLSLSKTLFTSTASNQTRTLTSLFLDRTFSSKSPITTSLSLSSKISRLPLSSAAFSNTSCFRSFCTCQSQNALTLTNNNGSNDAPKEILFNGLDYKHWLVHTDPPPENATRDEIIQSCIKILALVLGSEEEARKKIYSVSTKHYFAFGALLPEELSFKLQDIPCVLWVLPDYYLDRKNKDYGGEPFIDGQAVPYDPKYHKDWLRRNAIDESLWRARRHDRLRNANRSRNFERRRPKWFAEGTTIYAGRNKTNQVVLP